MRIGIDFDNTIVSYDALFHKVASELDCIDKETPQTKLAVRDHLRKIGRESLWTEIQGIVYGSRMSQAVLYPGVTDFFNWANLNKHNVFIISHKTRFPYLGKKEDLHYFANLWISENLRVEETLLIDKSSIFFELTKEDKIRRIKTMKCDYFIDDLPEVLMSVNFPTRTKRILFDPINGCEEQISPSNFLSVQTWQELKNYLSV